MSLLVLAALLTDPQLSQIVLEGRSQETHIEMSFRGKPTFQSFRSHQPNTLVVDIVGASLPSGFPKRFEVVDGVVLHLDEHVGSRTRLMRMRISLPKRLEPKLTASARAVHVVLPVGSTVARALGPSGAAPEVEQALALRLQQRLKTLEGAHRSAQGQLTEKEEQIERLSRRLSEALAQVKGLDAQLAAGKKRVADSERARQVAEGQAAAALQAVRATQDEARQEVVALRSQEAKQLQANSQGLRELEARRDDIDQLLRDQERLKSQLAALARVATKQQRESDRLVQTEVGLRADVESGQAALGKRTAALRQLNQSVDRRQKQLEALQRSRRSDAARLKRTDAAIRARKQDLAVTERARKSLARNLKSAKSKLTEREAVKAALDSEYEAVRRRNDALDKALADVVQSRKRLGRQLKSKRTAVKKTKAQIQKTKQAERSASAAVATLERSIASVEAERSKATQSLERAQRRAAERQRRVQALRAKLEPLKGAQAKLEERLAQERQRGQAADALVAQLGADLSAQEKRTAAGQRELERLKRQRRAQSKRAAQLAAQAKRAKTRSASTQAQLKAVKKPAVPKPVLVADARRVEPKPRASDATPATGFGGGPASATGRFERIGYRPVGPERVLIRFGGNAKVTMTKVGKRMTRVRLPGVSGASKKLRALDTSLFGGLVESIRPKQTRRGMTIELRHEQGIEFHVVRTVSGVELRVR